MVKVTFNGGKEVTIHLTVLKYLVSRAAKGQHTVPQISHSHIEWVARGVSDPKVMSGKDKVT